MNSRNFTEGKIGKNLLFFMLPVIASSLIQQLYSTVDLVLIGQFSGKEGTAAIGAGDLIITCLIGFFNGMAVGTNVITAHIFGRQDKERLKKMMQTVLVFGMAGGVTLMAIGIGFAPIFLRWMNTPESILGQAVVYLRIYMLSMIAIVLYNLYSGMLRAIGDSRSPMIFQTLGGIINIVADIVFIAGFHQGVAGAAIATFLSQTTAAVLVVLQLHNPRREVSLQFTFHGFDNRILKSVAAIGIPTGVQSIITTLSNIVVQSRINEFGVDTIAAFTSYFKIELIIYIPLLAIGQGVVSFAGQNYGAGKYKRMNQGFAFSILIGVIYTVVVSTLLLVFSHGVFSLFTSSEEVIAVGKQVMGITFPLYFIYVFLECFSSQLRGMGKAFPPMLITIISFCLIRIVLLFIVLSRWHDIRGVAIIYPITWGIAVICLVIYWLKVNHACQKEK
jgi:putative MATE family efflux protein